ncbi:Uu.00g111320.m01.CDS01 [Anthostomella pinea]|uniref:Uu.00g111320.m01.CDS01 n=1 Tax=Anthostomella pinea TaxID=933095 RepID=A0AAI8VF15_9PEZI|nr:Uu.00g111320.m01.CDS01 [Anthostomella pinea]
MAPTCQRGYQPDYHPWLGDHDRDLQVNADHDYEFKTAHEVVHHCRRKHGLVGPSAAKLLEYGSTG